jgi:hypothetical protein
MDGGEILSAFLNGKIYPTAITPPVPVLGLDVGIGATTIAPRRSLVFFFFDGVSFMAAAVGPSGWLTAFGVSARPVSPDLSCSGLD